MGHAERLLAQYNLANPAADDPSWYNPCTAVAIAARASKASRALLAAQ